MFGYLTADAGRLTEEQFLRYRACYCGLCRTLQARHGTAAQLTLNYDITLLILLLSSLYEPQESESFGRCVPHPFEERKWVHSEIFDYAADMNIALAYLKCMDDWADDGSLKALSQAQLFKSTYREIENRYPRQCAAIAKALDELHSLEKSKNEDADAAAACFGKLMAEIFVYKEDYWSGALRSFGMALGRFIYILDAVMDLDADAFRNRYNPFRRYYGLDNSQRFRDILKLLLGDCIRAFDFLPLVQDADIIKNILCDGLWLEFDKKYKKA